MSRYRISAKIRTNPDYQAVSRYLVAQGIAFDLRAPDGKGHPFLIIADSAGKEQRYHIACTPRGRCNTDARVASLKRFLRRHGII